MNFRTPIRVLVLVSALPLVDCGSATEVPTAPSQTQLPVPPATANSDPAFHVTEATLSGVVFENTPSGRVPIQGVDVLNGEGGATTTDAKGAYSLRPLWVCPCAAQPWVEAGTTFLWIRKEGYGDPAGTPASVFGRGTTLPGTRDVKVEGDTRFDIELVRR